MVPWHFGHTSGSTSKICRSNAAHRCPPARGLGGREPRRGHHRHRSIGTGGLCLTTYPARAVGIPAIVPRGHVALVRDVDQHARQELQRVGCLGTRRGRLRASDLSERYVTLAAARSEVSRSRATGFRPQ